MDYWPQIELDLKVLGYFNNVSNTGKSNSAHATTNADMKLYTAFCDVTWYSEVVFWAYPVIMEVHLTRPEYANVRRLDCKPT